MRTPKYDTNFRFYHPYYLSAASIRQLICEFIIASWRTEMGCGASRVEPEPGKASARAPQPDKASAKAPPPSFAFAALIAAGTVHVRVCVVCELPHLVPPHTTVCTLCIYIYISK